MLGFDAMGVLAMGQIPPSPHLSLAALTGAYLESGNAALFKISQAEAAGSFTVTGLTAALGLNALAASTGLFAVSGGIAHFSISEMSSMGVYSMLGIDAGYTRDFVAWIPRPFEGSSWSSESTEAATWTPATVQPEVWTPE